MSVEQNKAVLRREVEEIFAPEYVSHEPTSGEVRGIEGARQFAATFREAFPDLQNTIEDMVAEGDKVVMRFRGNGTHEGETEAFGPPTGKRMEITGITIKRLADGKMVEDRVEVDQLGMMQQLGVIALPQHTEA
jgi:predicted ester cyclase